MFKESIASLLVKSLAVSACAILVACLDIPDSPDSSEKITSIDIYVKQFGESRTEPLKVNSNDSARLIASVNPENLRNKVRYYWYNDEDLMDSGSTYEITTNQMVSEFISNSFIPNRVTIVDDEGNSLEKTFSVTVNAPPRISSETEPADGDTLYGNIHTPFKFQWSAEDNDSSDSLHCILEIDDVKYNVENLESIMQSGFTEGRHSFRIIVTDSFGDSDSLDTREFLVLDTLEGR